MKTIISKNYEIIYGNKQVFLKVETSDDGTITHANLTVPALFETIQDLKLPPKLEVLENIRDAFNEVLDNYYDIFGGEK